MMYPNPQAVVLVNGKCLKAFAIERSVPQGCSMSPLFYVLALDPLLRCWLFYADDITVFVSHRLDIKPVKKEIPRYEQIAGAKINFDESEGLRQGALKGGVPLPGSFHWSDRPICILGPGL